MNHDEEPPPADPATLRIDLVDPPSGDYAITTMYSVPGDAWHVELELVREQRTVAIAVVPDEDPAHEPTVCFVPRERHLDIPFGVMRWFMDQVEEEIRTSRAWMRLRPELVEVVHRLRREHFGAVVDDDFDEVLVELRGVVAGSDLPVVLAAAFGRHTDGTALDGIQAFRLIDGSAAGSRVGGG
ncbi:hypothetical protein [Kitasatospora sp. NPDC057500]|uniref:hypothetical protein n=1 Tax=Kitasatospora sp. NPDC057500 TaxID=3346151 RepID=UPI0036B9D7FB